MTTIMNDMLFKLNPNSNDCGTIEYLNEKAKQEGFEEGMKIVVDSTKKYKPFSFNHINGEKDPLLEVSINDIVAIIE